MHPLDALIRRYVAPLAKAAGCIRSGRTFRLIADSGDQAMFDFHTHAVDPDMVVFEVNWHIAPLPYWEWITRQRVPTPKLTNSSGAMATCRVMPPQEAAHHPRDGFPFFRERWVFPYEGSDKICGQALERTLREETLPRMRHLLDRSNLLEVVRSRDVSLVMRMNPLAREIVLRVDSGPVEEISALIAQEEATGRFPPFAQWARRRLAERIPN
ncbi:hypothetical protein [Streptomyces sp. NPDC052107]|uniref:hypothetical protein n=1 Tax=Streptomyces sp. NPDC052107 TaxID=3155632 RepID=UPI003425BD71